jgi:ribonuclease P/MRP protein subunit RPP40
VWAFKNVLNSTMTWLFCDLSGSVKGSDVEVAPIEAHAPVMREVKPESSRVEKAMVPEFSLQVRESEYEQTAELLEWLGLAMLVSPRILKDDNVDAFLSRYQVPTDEGDPKEQNLVRLQWRGLIPPVFAHKLLLAAMKAAGQQWVALNGQAFNGEAYMVLINNGYGTTWEYKD